MVVVKAGNLISLIQKIFETKGLSQQDAEIIAKALVEANLRGHDSHGVLRAKPYVERLERGGAVKSVDLRIIRETPVSAVIDGGSGLGMPVAYRAAKLTRQKAETAGMATVVVRNSNHYGAAAVWTDLMAQDDMIAFSCTNTEALMAPPGGKDVALGTNPICVSIPTASYGNVCLDLATSTVAQGKLFDYRLRNETLPDGWAVDEEGIMTNDPQKAKYLLPFAAHKGFGFAVIVEIMSALLAAGPFGKNVRGMYSQVEEPNDVSHCFMALSIDAFRDTDEFKEDMDSFVEYLHSIPAAEGQRIYFPGEIETNRKVEHLTKGISLDENLVQELTLIAEKSGLKDIANYFT